ncbi:hypothetical protein SDC9_208205 [bioreactor metagenome]|uniref:Uncharacterized protein n=1 Tax=bioreactor metagenome TaxID=1076179 RepID=A0A645JAP7_9ZZZZ
MISKRAITGTGLKKCMPINLSGLFVAAASSVMEMEEVLVAMMTFSPKTASTPANIFFFRSMFSVAASMTRSAFTASATSDVTARLFLADRASSAVIFPFCSSLSIALNMLFFPLLANSSLISCMITLNPLCAATCAIPAPIVPDPITKIV